jgi:hypothetical protein
VPVYCGIALDPSAFLGENERAGGGETALSPELHDGPAFARLILEEEAQLLPRF